MYNPPRGHIHRPVKTPCMGCTERTVGCHAGCEKYAQYRTELEAEKVTAYQASADQHNVALYEVKNANKRRRRGGW